MRGIFLRNGSQVLPPVGGMKLLQVKKEVWGWGITHLGIYNVSNG